MADATATMEVESEIGITKDPISVEGVSKRTREDGEETVEKEEKRAKIDGEKSVEEGSKDEGEKIEEQKNGVKEDGKESATATIGPKTFGSAVEMFDYFYKILHQWTPNLNLNKYEHMVLLELLKQGHQEAERKIGKGVKSFQIRSHPQYKSRCFFLIREDDSAEDFSFRKCVDHILPLPENMQIKHDVNKGLRGRGGGGRGRGGRGRGRGGKKY